MFNQFESIDAQDGISRLAQLTPQETAEANAWFDEFSPSETVTPEQKQAKRDAAWLAWEAGKMLLNLIHEEVDSKLEAIHRAEQFELPNGKVIA